MAGGEKTMPFHVCRQQWRKKGKGWSTTSSSSFSCPLAEGDIVIKNEGRTDRHSAARTNPFRNMKENCVLSRGKRGSLERKQGDKLRFPTFFWKKVHLTNYSYSGKKDMEGKGKVFLSFYFPFTLHCVCHGTSWVIKDISILQLLYIILLSSSTSA